MSCLRTFNTHQIFWLTTSLLYWHNLSPEPETMWEQPPAPWVGHQWINHRLILMYFYVVFNGVFGIVKHTAFLYVVSKKRNVQKTFQKCHIYCWTEKPGFLSTKWTAWNCKRHQTSCTERRRAHVSIENVFKYQGNKRDGLQDIRIKNLPSRTKSLSD